MKGQKRGIAYSIAAAVVGVICFVGAKQLTSGGFAVAQRALTPTTQVEAQLDDLAARDPMLSSLAEHFPDEWVAMRAELAKDVKSTLPSREVNARAHARSRAFMQQHARATASAPAESLVALARAEASFIQQLQTDSVQYCADFGMRGVQPGSVLSPAAIEKLSIAARARVIATRQGLDAPQTRPRATDADWAAVLDSMQRNGMPEAQIVAFAADSENATPAVQCEASVHLYRAVSELPSEEAAKMFGELLIEAAKGP